MTATDTATPSIPSVPEIRYEDPAIAVLCAAVQDTRERLQDLLTYADCARTSGTRENTRLHREPAAVMACISNYAAEMIDLLAAGRLAVQADRLREACAHGFTSSCPEGCN